MVLSSHKPGVLSLCSPILSAWKLLVFTWLPLCRLSPLLSTGLCLATPVLDMPCVKVVNEGAKAELAVSIP